MAEKRRISAEGFHPLQFTTLAVVMPSCILTYLGEAAYLTSFPETYTNPYFAAIPEPIYWPVFVVATAASVVAAQSLITGTGRFLCACSQKQSCYCDSPSSRNVL